MRTGTVILAVSALFAVVSSCAPKQREESSLVVRRIIGDKDDRYHRLIAASAVPDTQGEILMIGSVDECRLIAEAFATVDVRDNADGSFRSDGIPDFAGETIACVIDTTDRPEKYLFAPDAGLDTSPDVRRYLLNGFLSAMDTVCHVSPDDVEGLGRRRPAKLMIYADPFLASIVRHDVDTLFAALGSKVNIVSPSDAISEAMFGEGTNRNVVATVLFSPFFAGLDDALDKFMAKSLLEGRYGSSISCFNSHAGSDSRFNDFIDDYIADGYTRPVEVLAVADFSADIAELEREYAELVSSNNETASRYQRYFAKKFRIVNILDATISMCYDRLREGGCFSPDIAEPRIVYYYCCPDPQDSFSNFLVPAQDVQR